MNEYELGGVHFLIHNERVYCRYEDVYDVQENEDEGGEDVLTEVDERPSSTEKKQNKCGICRKPGHSARTCPNKEVPANEPLTEYSRARAERPEDKRPLKEKVRELVEHGLSVEECYDALPDVQMHMILKAYEEVESGGE
ncbi:MAG: hypothetical protein ABJP87_04310 [Bauldia litoralis]|uniref:hypothetical protein n=1 Tax=Alphaproteobacteria TaxID=28211 RepID=UPI003265E119